MGEGKKSAGAQGEQGPGCGRQWPELGGQHGSPHGVRNSTSREVWGLSGKVGVMSDSHTAPQSLLSPFLYIHSLSCLWLILPGLFKSCLGTGALEGAGRPSPLPCCALAPPPAGYRLCWKSRSPGLGSVLLGPREGTMIPGGGGGML